jgi:hypothetical protein
MMWLALFLLTWLEYGSFAFSRPALLIITGVMLLPTAVAAAMIINRWRKNGPPV